MKVAMLQMDIVYGDVAANEKKAEFLLQKAAGLGAEVVVLPELWPCGYALNRLPELAQDLSGSSVTMLKNAARKHGLFIFGGSLAEKNNGDYYNTLPVIDRNGEIAGCYRKVHLFPLGLNEDVYFKAGDSWGLVETPWGLWGLALCYDLRFGAFLRNLALRGAQAIVIPAQWPALRIDHWQTLTLARAMENQIFLLACNRTGTDASGEYNGCSAIIDAWGRIVAGGRPSESPDEIILADVDLAQNKKARHYIPVYHDRRPVLDEINNSLLQDIKF